MDPLCTAGKWAVGLCSPRWNSKSSQRASGAAACCAQDRPRCGARKPLGRPRTWAMSRDGQVRGVRAGGQEATGGQRLGVDPWAPRVARGLCGVWDETRSPALVHVRCSAGL